MATARFQVDCSSIALTRFGDDKVRIELRARFLHAGGAEPEASEYMDFAWMVPICMTGTEKRNFVQSKLTEICMEYDRRVRTPAPDVTIDSVPDVLVDVEVPDTY